MSVKTKKAAAAAMAQLKKWSSRDRESLDRLVAVERYVGELRQERTRLNAEKETLQDRVDAFDTLRQSAEKTIASLESQTCKANAETRQAKNEASSHRQQVAHLKSQLDPGDIDPSVAGEDIFTEAKTVLRLMKALRKKLPAPPEPTGKALRHNIPLFNVRDFVKLRHGDEYMTLGQFVTVSCLAGFPVAFYAKTVVGNEPLLETRNLAKDPGVRVFKQSRRKFRDWMGSWLVGCEKWEDGFVARKKAHYQSVKDTKDQLQGKDVTE